VHGILEHLLTGDEVGAWSLYQCIDAPSAQEDRWAGWALINLERHLEAQDLLTRSVQRGCIEARIELATVERLLGDFQAAHQTLNGLHDFKFREAFDKVLFWREMGATHLELGQSESALVALQNSWDIVQGATDLQPLRAAAGQALGVLFLSQRQYRKATHYFSAGLEGIGALNRELRIRWQRARCQIYLGAFSDAKIDLDYIEQHIAAHPALKGQLAYHQGLLFRATEAWADSEEHFLSAAKLSRAAEEPELAFYAEINAATVQIMQHKLEQARILLVRAKSIARSPRDHATWNWRQGYYLLHSKPLEAMPVLEFAAIAFGGMNLPRETLACWLNHAEAARRAGLIDQAKQSLQTAVDLTSTADDAFAAIELALLPELKVWLTDLEPVWQNILLPAIMDSSVQMLELVTLGKSELRVNGKAVGLRMARTVEILAFLLKKPNRTKSEILVGLFPDTDPQQAINYFHKAKQLLSEAVPCLTIAFDARRKVYNVKCQFQLQSDFLSFQHLLSGHRHNEVLDILNTYTGAFLPEANSQWASEEREALAWNAVKIGLETLQQWFEAGEDQKCLSLATRLLDIEPYNPALSEYLVTVTLRLEGEVAAKRELQRLNQKFLVELGDVPLELRRLGKTLLAFN
jgi:tetratricopeptide (TPR) repeat protein